MSDFGGGAGVGRSGGFTGGEKLQLALVLPLPFFALGVLMYLDRGGSLALFALFALGVFAGGAAAALLLALAAFGRPARVDGRWRFSVRRD